MKAEQFSKNILGIDNGIRFAGVVEKSGHLYAGSMREETEEHLKGRNPEISFSQSAHIIDLRKIFSKELGSLKSVSYTYDKVKMVSIPIKDHILVLSFDATINSDQLSEKLFEYIKTIEPELSLYPPANIVNNEKKEILRNLFESGIPEDMIADQLDLDIGTVKLLISEFNK